MQQLNNSFKEGGLTCSFNDFQLSEYIQQKRRKAGRIPVKRAVERVGPQRDGTWVLSPSAYINDDGLLIDADHSKYTWIGHLYDGPGIAPEATACPILLPLSAEPLTVMLKWLQQNMLHNFIPAVLVVGSFAMALHYRTIVQQFLFCPVPLAFGRSSGTGKTTAMRCGLALLGVHPSRLFSRATYEKYSNLCATSYLPLGVDDPKSKSTISDLTVSLFNGAQEGTVTHGAKQPLSMAVVCANFTTTEQERFVF